jgi:hypothetical protein
VDDPGRRGLAVQWLLDLLEDYRLPTHAAVQSYLGSNLTKLAVLPPNARTLSQLITLMADGSRPRNSKPPAHRRALHPIKNSGHWLSYTPKYPVSSKLYRRWEYGGIFDGMKIP